MTEAIKLYNPNLRRDKQTVEVVLMRWEYSGTFYATINGNCKGFSVLESALDVIYDRLEYADYGNDTKELRLKDSNGVTLVCHDELDDDIEWLKEMVVSMRFVEKVPGISDD